MQANRQDRNAALLAAVLRGNTCAAVGDAEGISGERVRQVCRSLLRQLRRLQPEEDMPQHNHFVLGELRANKDFWMHRLERLHARRHSSPA